ncbi:hypothetical protein [Streptomyces sp. NPDC097619]|uniref:hypothetical protein n=1 Tax=Streptomyces sp. NPDC097619 TaxID=3157228 RepID=UPI00331CE7E2
MKSPAFRLTISAVLAGFTALGPLTPATPATAAGVAFASAAPATARRAAPLTVPGLLLEQPEGTQEDSDGSTPNPGEGSEPNRTALYLGAATAVVTALGTAHLALTRRRRTHEAAPPTP